MTVRYTLVLAVLLVLFTLVNSSNIGATREDIVHNADGGYSNLLIAIDENVPEDRQLLEVIQVGFHVITSGSFGKAYQIAPGSFRQTFLFTQRNESIEIKD